MVNINGYEIKSAFSGGEPLKAIYSNGDKVWPTDEPVPVDWGGLKFTALEEGEIGMTHVGTNKTTTKPNLSYSKNGNYWVEWDYTPISVVTGDIVYFNGINDRIGLYFNRDYSTFTSTCKIAASGNIMSLLYGNYFEGIISLIDKDCCFHKLFENCSNLTTAPELPATSLSNMCYSDMFAGCTSLTTAPVLPATILETDCYACMFSGCKGLTTAPALPATELKRYCYLHMFSGCTSLTTAPALPATTLANQCYVNMFSGCTSLTKAPALPATKLAVGCYEDMFYKCTSLINAPELPATSLKQHCYDFMFYGCTKLKYVKANFLTEPGTDYTDRWLSGVYQFGTFYANFPEATWPDIITRGESTVPAGWTITK